MTPLCDNLPRLRQGWEFLSVGQTPLPAHDSVDTTTLYRHNCHNIPPCIGSETRHIYTLNRPTTVLGRTFVTKDTTQDILPLLDSSVVVCPQLSLPYTRRLLPRTSLRGPSVVPLTLTTPISLIPVPDTTPNLK